MELIIDLPAKQPPLQYFLNIEQSLHPLDPIIDKIFSYFVSNAVHKDDISIGSPLMSNMFMRESGY